MFFSLTSHLSPLIKACKLSSYLSPLTSTCFHGAKLA